jgi:hypothetical protein
MHPASDKAVAGHVHCGGHAEEQRRHGRREDQQAQCGQGLQGPI